MCMCVCVVARLNTVILYVVCTAHMSARADIYMCVCAIYIYSIYIYIL